MLKNILLIAPTSGNGGITTWTKNYLRTNSLKDINFISIDSSLKSRLFTQNSTFIRIYAGLIDLFSLVKIVKKEIQKKEVFIMHTTTSGSFGTLRDYILCKICKNNNIKTILHCHYGNIPQILSTKPVLRYFLLKTMKIYDQIWVLDEKTRIALIKIPVLKTKVLLTPNFIEVNDQLIIKPKTYNKVAFIGNLIPEKGIFELIEAVTLMSDIKLFIVGPGHEDIIQEIIKISESHKDKIIFLGPKSNADALEFMKNIDIIALPTYYESEAFPISILEAMSLGKLVISTDRAAIPDMLTSSDGLKCGLIVEERNSKSICNALEFALRHSQEADMMCKRAYEKVFTSYKTEVIHERYLNNYKALLEKK